MLLRVEDARDACWCTMSDDDDGGVDDGDEVWSMAYGAVCV